MKALEYNLSIKSSLIEKYGKELPEIFDREGSGPFQRVFKCVDCEALIPWPTIRFFKFDVLAVKCYDCQKSQTKDRQPVDLSTGCSSDQMATQK